MTVAYEFSTQIAENGTVILPSRYRGELPTGAQVRVILLTEEGNGQNGHRSVPLDEVPFDDEITLEELVERIKQMGPNPKKITPDGGNLAQKLANPLSEPDPDFDLEEWTRQWEAIEAEMKRSSREYEAQEWQELN